MDAVTTQSVGRLQSRMAARGLPRGSRIGETGTQPLVPVLAEDLLHLCSQIPPERRDAIVTAAEDGARIALLHYEGPPLEVLKHLDDLHHLIDLAAPPGQSTGQELLKTVQASALKT